ncbi:SurA N-terminal domain-containing protein [Gordonibacter massiliensis (ex Traore et al. 2017)]|uniref:SurA N-terminal domain-containing protein n=1 Tax=Gordonibacter massiliensis (ex Traore et al. 2017) TaxID=1841863 RepID=A0A842JDM0_9ACTN|nr:SurA N-terminal domain-containing protein [Gordonibacter massiliensis (ex Traore et al. 2017)]MBC2887995.1 SurA N-terminal domain-containing protein [Gordonibacter massiliensis (ex Traore et al. 2017)]
MKTANIMKAVCVAGLAATCVWGLAACSSANANGLTGGVAATVNGTEIPEDDVTNMIQGIRSQMGMDGEDEWGQWLADNAMTPESVREQMIDSFVQQELIKQGAKEKNISVDSSEIDSIVNTMKANYDGDDKWSAALEQANFTEESYRENIENQLLQKKLTESFASDEEPSQEDLLQYAQMYASAYDGAKRSSHILFDSGDEATAQSVLDQINSGELDFAEAAKQYSKDNDNGNGGSAAKGGDVGWDKLNSFVTEYTDALNGLEKDQVSGLVTSQYGIHIIKCTDVFNAPKAAGEDGTETVTITSTDQIPSEFLDSIKASLKQQKQNEAAQTWFSEYKESADIVINPMPEGLPYAVDMSKYTPAEGSTGATQNNSDGTDTGDGDTANNAGDNAEGSGDAASGENTEGSGDNANANASDQPAEGGDAANQQPAEAA